MSFVSICVFKMSIYKSLGKFCSSIEQKVQIWPKVLIKVSQIASPSVKLYTGTTTLASIRKNSVFFPYD